MRKILAYPLTVIYFIFFGLTLVVFHPIQWICLRVFGYKAHKISVDWLNFFLLRCLNLLGTRFSFNNPHKIPTNRPCIIVANHQSMYDIPPIIWYMRKHHAKFISKKELGKGIPSISFNLKHGGAALIDRKDPDQALKAIQALAASSEQNSRSVVIFPEGTRSRTGHPKKFQTGGLKVLFKGIPSALVVPISINNSWKTLRYGKFPMGIGTHMKFQVHEPIELKGKDHDTLINQIEETISKAITV
ncbi:lysophospholipid acyltransferase family protein [Spongiivirga citrea]|uniref:1-acyl-sn-glycerol-3-phosphate acyltransferase n=1 Tax=Spongiivirga citrea TaxID=1481457 RepID=A0A6M0CT36_9FLAO|nr:lysophospholipid acyltransferase family protein [Spongiivirga citrea]NER19089.1 1-acyl-sn-glycerol-3-phosphate acyltransferase [Spongiivirga citrea]